jgi:hypothetical protein
MFWSDPETGSGISLSLAEIYDFMDMLRGSGGSGTGICASRKPGFAGLLPLPGRSHAKVRRPLLRRGLQLQGNPFHCCPSQVSPAQNGCQAVWQRPLSKSAMP